MKRTLEFYFPTVTQILKNEWTRSRRVLVSTHYAGDLRHTSQIFKKVGRNPGSYWKKCVGLLQ